MLVLRRSTLMRTCALRTVASRARPPKRVHKLLVQKRCKSTAVRCAKRSSRPVRLVQQRCQSTAPQPVAPFPVRCTIVGAATAVATPLFPVIGSYRLACYLVPNKGARFIIVGSAAGVFSFAIRDALPYLVAHAELMAPMALANGGVAAVAYGVLEAAAGGPAKLLDRAGTVLPRFAPIWLKAAGPAAVVGAGIGLATALIAPYTYATLTELHFGLELPSTARFVDRLVPVTAPTGFVAGALLGPTLRPAITGSPWLAAPAVLFFAGGALYLYRDAAPVEPFAVGKGPGAYYVDEETRIVAKSVPRVDAVTLQVESQRGAERVDDGGDLASKGAALREALSDRSVRAYADARHARLDVALARFPFLASVLDDRALLETFSPAVDAQRALRTDAVARAAVLASQGVASRDAARQARREVEAAVPSARLGTLPVAAALAAVVAPESEVARSVNIDVEDLARLLKRHGVQVPASAYDDHVVGERRRKAWRLVGAALVTALVAVAREMM
jgi:hypothetical protein